VCFSLWNKLFIKADSPFLKHIFNQKEKAAALISKVHTLSKENS